MNLYEALILALVEALTEFFPISSTGHLILTSHFLGLNESEAHQAFNIVIQLGAVLAVVVNERRLLFQRRWMILLILSFIPTGIIGFILKKPLDQLLGSVEVVGWSLLIGGIVFLFIDKVFKAPSNTLENVKVHQGMLVGLIQSLALIPGVSRSASAMVGSRVIGLNREDASRFAFLLAVPTLGAASIYKAKDIFKHENSIDWKVLLASLLVCFVVSLFSLRTCLSIVRRFGFFPFGIYRIGIGLLILIFL